MSSSPRNVSIPVIGIVGGIGSGKSSVAIAASQIRPWFIIDADQLGHQALQLPEVISQLIQLLGAEILNQEGQIDRGAVAARVFGSDREDQRKILESIVHPHIHHLAAMELSTASQTGQYEAIILDAAILLEAGWRNLCEAVVFIDAQWEDRLARVQQTRGWDQEELKKREESQLSLLQKRTLSDAIIPNHGVIEQAAELLIAFVDEHFPTSHFHSR